jgi:5-methylcytosine-specific restriction endonuclease McrA
VLEKTDYIKQYYSRGYRTFETRCCLMCGDDFEAPKAIKKITTCSVYCKVVKLALQKSKGKYTLCRICDKPIWSQPKKNKQFCSVKCKNIGTSVYTAERAITRGVYRKYYGDNWLPQRDKARERDSYTCKTCGIFEMDYGRQLSVHHIKPFVLFNDYREANKLSNLIAVCEPCHRRIHSGDLHHSRYINR